MDSLSSKIFVLNAAAILAKNSELLNELDAKIGDGDLGGTAIAVSDSLISDSEIWNTSDLGHFFQSISISISKSSGSSLSALSMTTLQSLSKLCSDKTQISGPEFGTMLEVCANKMMSVGGAKAGDKSIVDAVLALSVALKQSDTSEAAGRNSISAMKEVLNKFRDQPFRVGRGRLSRNGGVGFDDPGMVALSLIVEATGAENHAS